MSDQLLQFILFALQGLGGIFCTILWTSYRDMKKKQEEQQKEHAEYKLYVEQHFVTKPGLKDVTDSLEKSMQSMAHSFRESLKTASESFERSIGAMFKKLDQIDEKLDKKVDKP